MAQTIDPLKYGIDNPQIARSATQLEPLNLKNVVPLAGLNSSKKREPKNRFDVASVNYQPLQDDYRAGFGPGETDEGPRSRRDYAKLYE